MSEEPRTLSGDFRQIVIMLLELHAQQCCEMCNMGDWTGEDLRKAYQEIEAAQVEIKNNKTFKAMTPNLWKAVIHTFANYAKTFQQYPELE